MPHAVADIFPPRARSYLVLLAGFYYAPGQEVDEERWPLGGGSEVVGGLQAAAAATVNRLPFLMDVAAHVRGFFA